MVGGYIRLHRQLENHWIAENNDYFHWWVDMLWMAKYQDTESDGITIKRGQLEASVAFLTKRWLLNRKTLDRKTVISFLKKLENDNMIIREVVDSKKAIITICNYDKYQYEPWRVTDTELDTISDTELDTILDTIKKIKKKRNNINTPLPPRGGNQSEQNFVVDPAFAEAFELWLQYKHEKRQTYKSEKALKICYNKLVKLSHGDPQIAMEIVEQSIGNNWAGLFELKENDGRTNNQPSGGGNPTNTVTGFVVHRAKN